MHAMTSAVTLMETEARETHLRVAEQFAANAPLVADLVARLKAKPPKFIMVVGRGSSDHAGVFAKYLIEIEIGIPVFAAAPSVATVYGKTLALDDAMVLVISQSGRSPDLLAQTELAKRSGAYCVALVNDEASPLAQMVDFVLPLRAGKERSVAATKSYLATLACVLQLTASWSGSALLAQAVAALPAALATVCDSPAQLGVEDLTGVDHLVTLGRGLGFAISKEMALKLKEVCNIHAEAFSSAEFLHGPVALVNRALTVIDITIKDESEQAHLAQVQELRKRGASLVHLNQVLADAHPRIAPLLLLQRFYIDVAAAAVAMGLNPDQPTGLKKVTETL